MVAVSRNRMRLEALRRAFLGWKRVPSARTVATIAAIVVTTVLILELGIWYFAGLIALYVALDVAQRLEERRDARTMMAILRTTGRKARAISFRGHARHC